MLIWKLGTYGYDAEQCHELHLRKKKLSMLKMTAAVSDSKNSCCCLSWADSLSGWHASPCFCPSWRLLLAFTPDSCPTTGLMGGRAAVPGAGRQQAACNQAAALHVFQNPNSGQPGALGPLQTLQNWSLCLPCSTSPHCWSPA